MTINAQQVYERLLGLDLILIALLENTPWEELDDEDRLEFIEFVEGMEWVRKNNQWNQTLITASA